LDDSGSMNTRDTPGGPTRWQELKETTQTMLDFAAYFDEDGTDLHFLNRDSVLSVSDPEDARVQQCFQKKPAGHTPLTEKVREVVGQHSSGDKPLLLVIATDGEPTGGSNAFKMEIERTIADPKRNVRFQIMACTDDDGAISWLNEFDNRYSEVDVCDDFQNERKEVLAAGRIAQFTRADWVMKALLGPISKKFDDWDQVSGRSHKRRKLSCGGVGPVAGIVVVAVVAVILAFANL